MTPGPVIGLEKPPGNGASGKAVYSALSRDSVPPIVRASLGVQMASASNPLDSASAALKTIEAVVDPTGT